MGRKGGREGGRAYLALEVDDLLDLLIRETTFGRDELLALLSVGVKEAGGDLPREGGREGGRDGWIRWIRRGEKRKKSQQMQI